VTGGAHTGLRSFITFAPSPLPGYFFATHPPFYLNARTLTPPSRFKLLHIFGRCWRTRDAVGERHTFPIALPRPLLP